MAAEYRNLKLDSCSDVCGIEEKKGAQKIIVSDHTDGAHYPAGKSDSFLIDMESISLCSIKDVHPSSIITRSLSRKGSQRGGSESKTNGNTIFPDREHVASSSPKASFVGCAMPENSMKMEVGTTDPSTKPQVNNQIIAGNSITTTTENRMSIRRNSFRRPSASWIFDPKRVLLLFASLSSMGTILLIYFTLTISQPNGENNSLDWQQ